MAGRSHAIAVGDDAWLQQIAATRTLYALRQVSLQAFIRHEANTRLGTRRARVTSLQLCLGVLLRDKSANQID